MRSFPLPAAFSLAVLGLLTLALSAAPASADDITVDTGNLYFCDASFENGVCESEISVGDTVTWNVSAGFHTATQCDASFTTCGAGFDSGSLEPGDTYSFTFDTAGTYPYRCEFHPDEMLGRIVVTEPTPTPTPAPTSPGQTAAPTQIALPKTGGPPGDAGSGVAVAALIAAALALFVVSGLTVAVARIRRD